MRSARSGWIQQEGEGLGVSDDRDALVYQAIGGDPDNLTHPPERTVEVPESLLWELAERVEQLEATVNRLENGQSPPAEDDPLLYAYAWMVVSGDGESLSTSETIAVTLHRNWDDIAWSLGDVDNRRFGVDTKTKANVKYQPSRLRYRLREQLGWDPANIQIYRGLKRLASLSGGEERVDARSNRVHISGGEYAYREMATADNQDVKRVVWRETE